MGFTEFSSRLYTLGSEGGGELRTCRMEEAATRGGAKLWLTTILTA